jgi:hypothetical protein
MLWSGKVNKSVAVQGSGTVSNTVAALDWVAQNMSGPSIVTLSLGIGEGLNSKALADAVQVGFSLNPAHWRFKVGVGRRGNESMGLHPPAVPWDTRG